MKQASSQRLCTTVVSLGLVTALLSACGSGGDAPSSASPSGADTTAIIQALATATTAPLRGTLLNGTVVTGTLTKATIDSSVSAAEAPLVTGIPGVTSAAGNAKCDVQVVRLIYGTITPAEAPKSTRATSQASAGLLIPGAGCPTPWALVSNQHGTIVNATSTLTSPKSDAVVSMAAYFGSQGYVVVLPDYHGYGSSSLGYHPYLQAEPGGAIVVDAVRAARNWLHQNGYDSAMSGKLFLAGTSEGGYVTMAAQRTMERYFPSEFALTATAPTSGPYQVDSTLALFMSTPDSADESKSLAATFILEGFQKTYGDTYATPSDVYNTPWAAEMGLAVPLLPSHTAGGEGALRKSCQLPYNLKDAASASTPTYPGCSATPLLTAAFVSSYVNQDAGLAANARAHAATNSLLQLWQPTSKTFICYGDLDDMATPNARAAQSYFASQGRSALMSVEDVQTETREPIATWIATQVPLHPPGAGYHGIVEATACTSWTRHTVFDPLR